MTSGIGKPGFTLIEVLVGVSILAIGLAGILTGYGEILGSYKKARLLMDGVTLLEERMTDQELEIRGGMAAVGARSGKEGAWSWSTQTRAIGQEGWYEIKGAVRGVGSAGTITLDRYVRQ